MKLILLLLLPGLCYSQRQKDTLLKYIDQGSLASVRITANRDNAFLKSGTGFFIAVNSYKVYFLTNDHMVGGQFDRDEYFRLYHKQIPKEKIPNTLVFNLFDFAFNRTIQDAISIRDTNGTPLWIPFWENEEKKSGLLDVIAIKMDMGFDFHNMVIYTTDANIDPSVKLRPTSELFVVGYPVDSTFGTIYPVWKRGTVASEPNLSMLGNSCFLIDATTRRGMSGSPVLFIGSKFMAFDGTFSNPLNKTFLVGIYNSQSYPMELGGVISINKIIQKLQTLP